MHFHTMDSLLAETHHRREQLTRAWQRPPWGTALRRWLGDTLGPRTLRTTVAQPVSLPQAGEVSVAPGGPGGLAQHASETSSGHCVEEDAA